MIYVGCLVAIIGFGCIKLIVDWGLDRIDAGSNKGWVIGVAIVGEMAAGFTIMLGAYLAQTSQW